MDNIAWVSGLPKRVGESPDWGVFKNLSTQLFNSGYSKKELLFMYLSIKCKSIRHVVSFLYLVVSWRYTYISRLYPFKSSSIVIFIVLEAWNLIITLEMVYNNMISVFSGSQCNWHQIHIWFHLSHNCYACIFAAAI